MMKTSANWFKLILWLLLFGFYSCEKDLPIIDYDKECHFRYVFSGWDYVADSNRVQYYHATVNPFNPNQFISQESSLASGEWMVVFHDLSTDTRYEIKDGLLTWPPQWNSLGQVVFGAKALYGPTKIYAFDANTYQTFDFTEPVLGYRPGWSANDSNVFVTYYSTRRPHMKAELRLTGELVDTFDGDIPTKKNLLGELVYFVNDFGLKFYSDADWNSLIGEVAMQNYVSPTNYDWVNEHEIYYWNQYALNVVDRNSGEVRPIYEGCDTRLIKNATYNQVDDHFYLSIQYTELISYGKITASHRIFRIKSDGSNFEQYYP